MATIKLRTSQATPLEYEEVDANFTNLNNDKLEKNGGDFAGGTINNCTIGATTASTGRFTTLKIKDDSASQYVQVLPSSSTALTSDRTLYIDVINSNRDIKLAGNIDLAGNLTTSGAYALTLTTTASTSVTLPTSGTLYGTQTGSITSAQLLASMTDETGSGVVVFGTSPTFTTSIDSGATFSAFASASTLTLGYTGVVDSTLNISTGVVGSTRTKTINIGTGAGAGSTTNINLGSAIGGTTTTNGDARISGYLGINQAPNASYRLGVTGNSYLTGTLTVTGDTYAPGHVVQCVYLRGTDTSTTYAYPVASTSTDGSGGNTAGGAEIAALTQAFTTKYANSKVKLTYHLTYESTTNCQFVISRNGVVISRSSVGSAYASTFVNITDGDSTTTPTSQVMVYVDVPGSVGTYTYRLHVQSSTAATGTLTYNKAVNALAAGVEGGISQVIIEEIAV